LTYLLSICLVLVVPSCLLAVRLRSRIQWPSFAIALSAISVIGCSWSAVVTAHKWWSFASGHVTGWRPLPYLLVEEVIFYPAGGALCILLYLAFARQPARPRRGIYVAFLVLGTTLFATLALSHGAQRPYYLYSQLLVYNLLVCGTLAPMVAHRIDFRGFAATTPLMAIVGYVWDHVAFVGAWWKYHAITQLHLGLVPFDDLDFFLFAPAAAISIHELARSSPVPARPDSPKRV
jgi:lycopene cyclase domain-containing protein